MKTILACLLVLAVSLPVSNASCFIQPMKPGTSDGCLDSKGNLHQFESKWRTDDCMDCYCSRDAIQCCTSYATPVGYDEEKCVRIFDEVTCTYKVLEKNDHSKECPVYEWVG
ncbi:beta-microseminoprotein J1-like [Melanerpes formicivorus]|uniref:beta-microseminoprotein J1-like n=1 Tax=Melanerpes formicivorus TaxID=211600 RepID=UPI00358FF82C